MVRIGRVVSFPEVIEGLGQTGVPGPFKNRPYF